MVGQYGKRTMVGQYCYLGYPSKSQQHRHNTDEHTATC